MTKVFEEKKKEVFFTIFWSKRNYYSRSKTAIHLYNYLFHRPQKTRVLLRTITRTPACPFSRCFVDPLVLRLTHYIAFNILNDQYDSHKQRDSNLEWMTEGKMVR